MKQCPKCQSRHNKNGKFCSRICANSRVWTKEDKIKRSLSALCSDKVKTANQSKAKNQKKRQKNLDNWKIILCKVCQCQFSRLKSDLRKTCSSKCAKLLPMGGLRKNSGIGKSGWYKGFWLNSTYELAFVIYHLNKNITIKRCNEWFSYIDPVTRLARRYYPDFIVDGKIIEIKGYKKQIDEIKTQSCGAVLLCKEDLHEIFEYVEKLTGIKIEHLHSLYEK